jgi:lipid-A-disaccharide synthase
MLIGIVAGELSGDVLGAGLIRALRQYYPTAKFIGIAGPKMLAEGCETLVPIEELSVMGFTEVIKQLPRLYKLRQKVTQYFLQQRPDIYIGIDAPDFNLSVETKLKKAGIRTTHYVSPSVWAWRRSRVKYIQKAADLLLTLLPFEPAYYDPKKIRVQYVGHPLADKIPLENPAAPAREQLNLLQNQRYITILPGSRAQEINFLMKDLLDAAEICYQQQPDIKFLIAAANAERHQQITEFLKDRKLPIQLIDGQTQAVIAAADVVLAASGTVTLEVALIKRPLVVTYRVAPLTWWLGVRIIKIPYLALPNWLAGKKIVPEILQDEATPENLAKAVLEALNNPEKNQELYEQYRIMHQKLKCNASEQAAKAIKELLAHLSP